MRTFKYISIFLVVVVGILCVWHLRSPYLQYNGKIFGTYYSVKIKSNIKNNELKDKIKQTLKDVNDHMSMFEKDSEVSVINRTNKNERILLSPEMQYLLEQAAIINQQSSGAFDPTVGRLVNLWGFGTTKMNDVPKEEYIKKALESTGFAKHLTFDNNYQFLVKDNSLAQLDLSAIAKGYGVDKVAELLEKEGYTDFVVEIGGEVRGKGSNAETPNGWNVGVARPSEKGFENAFVLTFSDYAAATSGDYRNFFYKDGKRYAHTISPFDGHPVEHNLASVTVFNKKCMLADAYATAIMALGEKKGLEFADKYDIPAVFFIRNQDDVVTMQMSQTAIALIGK